MVSWKRLTLPIVTTVISVVVCASLVEFGLRLFGRVVPATLNAFGHAPLMTRIDDELGWVTVPGQYTYSTTGEAVHRIDVTVDADRTRGGAQPPSSKEEVWFFGCSFTFGWGVTDGDDFVARLAAKLPRYRLRNFGVPGYGTVQSLLRFRQELAAAKAPPRLVIYGQIDQHDIRNAATRWWRMVIDRAGRGPERVLMPSARLDDDRQLVLLPPVRYRRWPLSTHSVAVYFLEKQWAHFRDQQFATDMHRVTQELIRVWNKEVARVGATFVVVPLWMSDELAAGDRRQLWGSVIGLEECREKRRGPEFRVPGDDHPNARVHAGWADCIFESIEPLLDELRHADA